MADPKPAASAPAPKPVPVWPHPYHGYKPHQPYKEPEPTYPNGETVKQRNERLDRECKGRPNAGMCLGHAS